eukprot:CAMPEP_0114584112 /NCGR_PEP_ID=MMETSP0125-20121206/7829_1 /TAXON_ID=485358 ORGANISM="Aristerostoma sp., Strain ATCC 50986" /NCGR_SAMPLE_ID=MMETSP0125 /ASSEMBLY_ACC=CAM_ASM_000245 /LENGTH=98 /DNA_ID=CAMNT_0001778211 /DNA_START=93 /DNA_END=392 /DNA_ORIENTATION=+
MTKQDILELCKCFQYEYLDFGKFVFKQGDASNNKFYVILSGEVAIIITKSSVGDWGKRNTNVYSRTSKMTLRKTTIKRDTKLGEIPEEDDEERKRFEE